VLLFLGILFPLIGVGLLVGGVVTAVWGRRKWAAARAAQGQVIDLERQVVTPGSAGVYCPVVRFSTETGQVVEFTSEHGSRPAMHKVGQTVRVRYDPLEPHQAEVDSALARWLVPGVMFAIGALFLCGGCMGILVYILMNTVN
jgi:hypothetical protein